MISGAKVVLKDEISNILQEFHGSTFGGHSGVNKTTQSIQKRYWWKGLTDDVKKYHHTDWDDFIDGALFAQRTKPQSSTKYSPFFLLYGREALYPSQLPKGFGDNQTENDPNPNPEDIENLVKERLETMDKVNSEIDRNIEKAQKKQKDDYKKRAEKGRPFTNFNVNDAVLVFNSKKASTKRKGNLTPNYEGPYTIANLEGKSATIKNESGVMLKKKVNIDRLKHFKQHIALDNNLTQSASKTDSQTTNDQGTIAKQFIDKINSDGSLKFLMDFVGSIKLSRANNMFSLARLVAECPVESLIAEVSDENEPQMDAFATHVIPHLRFLDIDLTAKTTLAIVISCVCVRAVNLFQPVMVIAETLKLNPKHLTKDISTSSLTLGATDRLYVINSFLRVLQRANGHIFVLPSYTAVLWNVGSLNHWLFKNVQFKKYRQILMPININNNHWVLLVANINKRTVAILDSMDGQSGDQFLQLWREFMHIRDSAEEVKEEFGPWKTEAVKCNKQTDGNSCGIFTLMNAECIASQVPPVVMRQVHCESYRIYVKQRLLQCGTAKQEDVCDMPSCINRYINYHALHVISNLTTAQHYIRSKLGSIAPTVIISHLLLYYTVLFVIILKTVNFSCDVLYKIVYVHTDHTVIFIGIVD
ncbi:hypothetical protein KUTeg_020864 [Tegillarca granosa]|uniref:Ubiquitin-like protease family profile domain-containing protein n=1 Tax=Tegillarca granosa TaxID=220873 RepID=A0ABQ9EDB8_TEGGR|nr:hypothetical protein KUTeg_020864 [Tegillarca granosa]